MPPETVTIDSSSSVATVNGWYKIDLAGATSFDLKLQLEERKGGEEKNGKFKPPSYIAISDTASINSATSVL